MRRICNGIKAICIAFWMLLAATWECFSMEGSADISEKQLHYVQDFGTTAMVYSKDLAKDIIMHRRHIHQYPELAYEEYNTSAYIVQTLKRLGIEEHNIWKDVALTGVVAHIGKGNLQSSLRKHALNISGSEFSAADTFTSRYIPTIALRADMDALKIQEEVSIDFKSKIDNQMHACGHDGHMAMLLGAAAILKRHEDQLITSGGSVRLVFQPAEEGGAGMKRLIEEGALNGVDAAVMLHTSPLYNVGSIISKAGVMMAASKSITINIYGSGGHAAAPHLTNDVIAATAAIINSVHTIVSRNVSPTESAVISLTFAKAGSAFNILPDVAQVGGTVRALSSEVMENVMTILNERVRLVAAAYGCSAEVLDNESQLRTNSRGKIWKSVPYPPTINDENIYALGMKTAKRMFGEEAIHVLSEPHMTGEDFSFLAQLIPSAMFWIGHKNEEHKAHFRTGHNLHNSKFELDERMLPRGSAFLSTLALEYIKVSQNSISTTSPSTTSSCKSIS